jgi:hypothetical protein
VACALPNLGVDLKFWGLAYRWIYRRPEKKALEAQKASTSLRLFRFAIFQQISAPARMAGYFGTAEAA